MQRLAYARHAQIAIADSSVANKDTPQFKNPNPALLTLLVILDIGNQASDQAGTHGLQVAGNGVEQHDRIGVAHVIGFPVFLHETEIDHFLVVQRGHKVAQLVLGAARLIRRQHRRCRLRRITGNIFKPVNAGDLFDQVFLYFQIKTEGWRHNGKYAILFGELKIELCKDIAHVRFSNRYAQHLAATLKTHGHSRACRQCNALIAHRTGLTTAYFQNQAGNMLNVLDDVQEIYTTLKTVAGFRAELVAARAPGDGVRKPE